MKGVCVADEVEKTRRFIIGSAQFPARPLEAALYVVATPIGNLGDMTLRGLETLAAADVLACEDTRVTRVLLGRYGIMTKPVTYHEHNAAEAGPRLLAAIEGGGSVALVSDAGTPLVSDPGQSLVAEARRRGLRIVPIPGASSVLAALVASGLPTDAFFFAGFLPSKAGQRRTRLEALAGVEATLVFFESPNRVGAALSDLAAMLGADRPAALCRELTKVHETVLTDTLAGLADRIAEGGKLRGEIVLLVGPRAGRPAEMDAGETDRLLLALADEMPASKAAGEAARLTGRRKADLYGRLLALRQGGRPEGEGA